MPGCKPAIPVKHMICKASQAAAGRVKALQSVKDAIFLLAQAQRRFRERQKTKFTELTGKVEELEGRLGELLSEKVRLEDRTSILEMTLELRQAGSAELDEPSALRRLNSVVWRRTLSTMTLPHSCLCSSLPQTRINPAVMLTSTMPLSPVMCRHLVYFGRPCTPP